MEVSKSVQDPLLRLSGERTTGDKTTAGHETTIAGDLISLNNWIITSHFMATTFFILWQFGSHLWMGLVSVFFQLLEQWVSGRTAATGESRLPLKS